MLEVGLGLLILITIYLWIDSHNKGQDIRDLQTDLRELKKARPLQIGDKEDPRNNAYKDINLLRKIYELLDKLLNPRGYIYDSGDYMTINQLYDLVELANRLEKTSAIQDVKTILLENKQFIHDSTMGIVSHIIDENEAQLKVHLKAMKPLLVTYMTAKGEGTQELLDDLRSID